MWQWSDLPRKSQKNSGKPEGIAFISWYNVMCYSLCTRKMSRSHQMPLFITVYRGNVCLTKSRDYLNDTGTLLCQSLNLLTDSFAAYCLCNTTWGVIKKNHIDLKKKTKLSLHSGSSSFGSEKSGGWSLFLQIALLCKLERRNVISKSLAWWRICGNYFPPVLPGGGNYKSIWCIM